MEQESRRQEESIVGREAESEMLRQASREKLDKKRPEKKKKKITSETSLEKELKRAREMIDDSLGEGDKNTIGGIRIREIKE